MTSSKIIFNSKSLAFNDYGKGFPIVLLHGYLETNEIWNNLAKELSKKFRVICPDLPGHGKSEYHENQTVELMANAVNNLLVHLKIEKVFLIGHSMGGYVALAFAGLFPEKLSALCLFHSNPYADSCEKKIMRLHEIELINKGKKNLIIKTTIPKLFAKAFIEQRKMLVVQSLNIALKTSKKGMLACLLAIMNRPDRTQVLKNMKIPVLWIAGKHDELFSYTKVLKISKGIKHIKTKVLEISGHNGMLEEPDKTLQLLNNFMESNNLKEAEKK